MNDKKKKFVIPEAEIVDFINEDILTVSNNSRGEWDAGEVEPWGWN